MVRLPRRLLALLLHIFTICHVQAHCPPRRSGLPWGPVPAAVYQTQQDISSDFARVFGDRFEVPLSRLKNVYLAGFDHEIYKLKDDVARESVRNELRVTFYLWTNHGFKLITTLYTDYGTLKRNINKYHHYFQLKKVYIERFTKKREWRIDKLIMLPSTFSDDIVFQKYDHARELMAAVEDPSTVILPEEHVNHPDAENQPYSEWKSKDEETDVLLDIYKKITGNKDKQNKKKKIEIDSNAVPDSARSITDEYQNVIADTADSIQEISYQSEEPRTCDRNNIYESAVTPGIFTEYNGKIVYYTPASIEDGEIQATKENISPGSFSEYTSQINPSYAVATPESPYLTFQNESNLKPKVFAMTADMYPFSNDKLTSLSLANQYNFVNSQKNSETNVMVESNNKLNYINYYNSKMKSAASTNTKIFDTNAEVFPYSYHKTNDGQSIYYAQYDLVHPRNKLRTTVHMTPIAFSQIQNNNIVKGRVIQAKYTPFEQNPIEYSKVLADKPVEYSQIHAKHNPTAANPIEYSQSIENPIDYSQIQNPAKYNPTAVNSIEYSQSIEIPIDYSQIQIVNPTKYRDIRTTENPIEYTEIETVKPVEYSQIYAKHNPTAVSSIEYNQSIQIENPTEYREIQAKYTPTAENVIEYSNIIADNPVEYSQIHIKHNPTVLNPIEHSQSIENPTEYSQIQSKNPVKYTDIQAKYINGEQTIEYSPNIAKYTTIAENPIRYSRIKTEIPADYTQINSKNSIAVNAIQYSQTTEKPIDNQLQSKYSSLEKESTEYGIRIEISETRTKKPIENIQTQAENSIEYNQIQTGRPITYSKIQLPVDSSETYVQQTIKTEEQTEIKAEIPEKYSHIQTQEPTKYSPIHTQNLIEYKQTNQQSPIEYSQIVEKSIDYGQSQIKSPVNLIEYNGTPKILTNYRQKIEKAIGFNKRAEKFIGYNNQVAKSPVEYTQKPYRRAEHSYPQIEGVKNLLKCKQGMENPIEYSQMPMKYTQGIENLKKYMQIPKTFTKYSPEADIIVPYNNPVKTFINSLVANKPIEYNPTVLPIQNNLVATKPVEYTQTTEKTLDYRQHAAKLVEYNQQIEEPTVYSHVAKKPIEFRQPVVNIIESGPPVANLIEYSPIKERPIEYSQQENQPIECTQLLKKPIDYNQPKQNPVELTGPAANAMKTHITETPIEFYKPYVKIIESSPPLQKNIEYSQITNKPIKYSQREDKPIEYSQLVENLIEYSEPLLKPIEYEGPAVNLVKYHPLTLSPNEYSQLTKKQMKYRQPESKPFEYNQLDEKPIVHSHIAEKPFEYSQPIQKPIEYRGSTANLVKYSQPVDKTIQYSHVEEKPIEYSQIIEKPIKYSQEVIKPIEQINYFDFLKPVEHSEPVQTVAYPVKYNHPALKPIEYGKPTIKIIETNQSVEKPINYNQISDNQILYSQQVNNPIECSQLVEQPIKYSQPIRKIIEYRRPTANFIKYSQPALNPIEYIQPLAKLVENIQPVAKFVTNSQLVKNPIEYSYGAKKPIEYTKPAIKIIDSSQPVEIPMECSQLTEKPFEYSLPIEYSQPVQIAENPVEYNQPALNPIYYSQIVAKPVAYLQPAEIPIDYSPPALKIIEMSQSVEEPIKYSQIPEIPMKYSQQVIKPIEYSKPLQKTSNTVEYNQPALKPIEYNPPTVKIIEIPRPVEKPIEYNYVVEKPIKYSKQVIKPIDYSQKAANPIEYNQLALYPVEYNQAAAKPDECRQPTVQSVDYTQVAVKPNNLKVVKPFKYSQIVENPFKYRKSIQKPVEYSQPSAKPIVFGQSATKIFEHRQPTLNQLKYSQPAVKLVEYRQPAANPVEYRQPTVKQPIEYNIIEDKPIEYSQSAVKIIESRQPLQKPIQYSQITEKPIKYRQQVDKPIEYCRPIQKTIDYRQLVSNPIEYRQTAAPIEYNQPVQKPIEYSQPAIKIIEGSQPVDKNIIYSRITENVIQYSQPVENPSNYNHIAKLPIIENRPVTNPVKSAINPIEYSQIAEELIKYSEPAIQSVDLSKPVEKITRQLEYKPIVCSYVAQKPLEYSRITPKPVDYNQLPVKMVKNTNLLQHYIDYSQPARQPKIAKTVEYSQTTRQPIKYNQQGDRPYEHSQQAENLVDYNQMSENLQYSQPVKVVEYSQQVENPIVYGHVARKPNKYRQPATKLLIECSHVPVKPVAYSQFIKNPILYIKPTERAEFSHLAVKPIKYTQQVINTFSQMVESPFEFSKPEKRPIIKTIEYSQVAEKPIVYTQPTAKVVTYNQLAAQPVENDQQVETANKHTQISAKPVIYSHTKESPLIYSQPIVTLVDYNKSVKRSFNYNHVVKNRIKYSMPAVKNPLVNNNLVEQPFAFTQIAVKPVEFTQPAIIAPIEYSKIKTNPIDSRQITENLIEYSQTPVTRVANQIKYNHQVYKPIHYSPKYQKQMQYGQAKLIRATTPIENIQMAKKPIGNYPSLPESLIKYNKAQIKKAENVIRYNELVKNPYKYVNNQGAVNPIKYNEDELTTAQKQTQDPTKDDGRLYLTNGYRQFNNYHFLPDYVSLRDNKIDISNTDIRSPEEKKSFDFNIKSYSRVPITYKGKSSWYDITPNYLPENKENFVSYNDFVKPNTTPKFKTNGNIRISSLPFSYVPSINKGNNNYVSTNTIPYTKTAFDWQIKPQITSIPQSNNFQLNYKPISYNSKVPYLYNPKFYLLPKDDLVSRDNTIDYKYNKTQQQENAAEKYNICDLSKNNLIKPPVYLYPNICDQHPKNYISYVNNLIPKQTYKPFYYMNFTPIQVPLTNNQYKPIVNKVRYTQTSYNMNPLKIIPSRESYSQNHVTYVNGNNYKSFSSIVPNFIKKSAITKKKKAIQRSYYRYPKYIPYTNKFGFTHSNNNLGRRNVDINLIKEKPHEKHEFHPPVICNNELPYTMKKYHRNYKPNKSIAIQQILNSVNSIPRILSPKRNNVPRSSIYSNFGMNTNIYRTITPQPTANIELTHKITPLTNEVVSSTAFKSTNCDFNPVIVGRSNTYSPKSTHIISNSLNSIYSTNPSQSVILKKPLVFNCQFPFHSPYLPYTYSIGGVQSPYSYFSPTTPSYSFSTLINSRSNGNIVASGLPKYNEIEKSPEFTYNKTPTSTQSLVSSSPSISDPHDLNLELLTNNFKTSIKNWLKTNPLNIKSIPIGEFGLASFNKGNNQFYVLKTDDPNILIKTWMGKVKVVKAKLTLETEAVSVINFLPEIVEGDYDPKAVQYMVKEEIKKKYGDPIVIEETSFYEPYVLVYNTDMLKSGKCTILWPTYNRKLNCWTT